MQRRTSSARSDDSVFVQDGFSLIEVVCVLSIIALLASVLVPTLPRSTSKTRLQSYAVSAAALLKADRHAAIRRQTEIKTSVDAQSRLLSSGSSGRTLQVPMDVTVDALLPKRCGSTLGSAAIKFFPSGMSCGGVIAFSNSQTAFEIRVNWLTGGVQIVPLNRS